jgi:hypothetical protein
VKQKSGRSTISINNIRAPKRDVPTAPDMRTILERQTFETLRLKAEIKKRTADRKKNVT